MSAYNDAALDAARELTASGFLAQNAASSAHFEQHPANVPAQPDPTPTERSEFEARELSVSANRCADELIASEGPEFCLALAYAFLSALPCAEFPRLRETRKGKLRCPHCNARCDRDEGIVVVDYATRWTAAYAYDPSDQTLHVSYDGSSDYDSLNYQCGTCQRPVSLPEGATEVTS